ncbi:MAG: PAS domain S-box protein [Phycisphaeraceae bacterium JB051]
MQAIATEARDDNHLELYMFLRAVSELSSISYVKVITDIPGNKRTVQAGNALLEYDEVRTYELPWPSGYMADKPAGVMTIYVTYDAMRQSMREESVYFLSFSMLFVLILTGLYFSIIRLTVTRHLSLLASHLEKINVKNLSQPMSWLRNERRPNQPDELDIIAQRIDELCANLYQEINQRESMYEEVHASKTFYQQIVEDQTELIIRFTSSIEITFVNQACCKLLGVSREQLIGEGLHRFFMFHELDHLKKIVDRFTPENNVSQDDLAFIHPTLGVRLISWKSRAFYNDQGELTLVQATGRDITDLAKTLQNLKLLNKAIESAPYGIIITDPKVPDNPAVYVNPAFEKISGYKSSELIGMNMRLMHRDDKSQPGVNKLREAIRKQKQSEVLVRNYRKDGSQFWVEMIVAPMHDQSGTLTNFISIQTDVTERVNANERQQLLVNELDHRVKNVLATVLALCSQTIRSTKDIKAFQKVYTGRLHALARAHEALAKEKWSGTSLHQLVELILGCEVDHEHMLVAGPPVKLLPRLSSPLSMTLHELLTNAMKYGALKDAAGSIRVTWEVQATPDGQVVELYWREDCPRTCGCCDGSHQPGTGMKLIKGLVEYEMNGKVDFSFSESGLECTLSIPNHPNISKS